MFKFSLQRVLDLRAKKEQEAAITLVSAREGAERARQDQEALEQARTDGVRRIAEARGGGLTVGHLQNLGLVIHALDQHIASARDQVHEADAEVDRRMTDFTSASQDRRVLDRLRQKHLHVWQSDEVQEDRKVMDAIALTRHARTRSSSNETP